MFKKCALNFYFWEIMDDETKVVEEHCWAITYAARRSHRGRPGFYWAGVCPSTGAPFIYIYS